MTPLEIEVEIDELNLRYLPASCLARQWLSHRASSTALTKAMLLVLADGVLDQRCRCRISAVQGYSPLWRSTPSIMISLDASVFSKRVPPAVTGVITSAFAGV